MLRTGALDTEDGEVKLAVKLFVSKGWTARLLGDLNLGWTGLSPGDVLVPRLADVLAMAQDGREERRVVVTSAARRVIRVLGKSGAAFSPEATEESVTAYLLASRCNNFSVFNDILVPKGAGVFPIGALLNHSCEGNCVMQYGPGHVQIVRAIRDVAEGEELCHSYLDQAAVTVDRQARLRADYDFTCDCMRCNDSSALDLALTGLLQRSPDKHQVPKTEGTAGLSVEPVRQAALVNKLQELAHVHTTYARHSVEPETALAALEEVYRQRKL